MAVIQHGGTLPDTAQKTDVYAIVDNGTVTSIVNADCSAGMALVDTKLAQITTASKVSGTALTGLANIPSAAGVIPQANIVTSLDGTIQFMVDGGGSVITTGHKGLLVIPFGCTLTAWTMVSDKSCTATMDINRQTYSAYDASPTSIVGGSSVPTITAAVKGQDLDIEDWTSVTIAAGDVLQFDVDSNNFAEVLTISLDYTRTA